MLLKLIGEVAALLSFLYILNKYKLGKIDK